MRQRFARTALVSVLVLATTGTALAQQPGRSGPSSRDLAAPSDGGLSSGRAAESLPPLTDGLPPTEKNVELVGKLQLNGRFGNVLPGQIADVSHKGDYAYLNSWQSETESRCDRGGVYIVNIADPANPREVGFIDSPTGTYPGEGSQVVTLNTPSFRGDLLTINNEACADPDSTPETLKGGITLVDVTNPLAPVVLREGFGDVTPPSIAPGVKSNPEHLVHSAFTWQSGQNAYTVMVDNEEFEDIDIVDVTNPRAPVLINEIDLLDPSTFNGGPIGGSAFGDAIFLHDMVVKQIGGRQIMLVSYWDGGYAKLDVTDPANVTRISDTDFGPADPLFGQFTPPEGNAHQAEFSFDNQFIVAADEDFSPARARTTVLTGAGAGEFNAAEPGDTVAPIEGLPDQLLGPNTTYVGTACTTETLLIPAAPADDGDPNTEEVAVIERGGAADDEINPDCTFANKIDRVQAAGWDGYVIFNQADRPDGDPLTTNSDSGAAAIPGVLMTRADALNGIFAGATATPAIGTAGEDIAVGTAFDGWGYAHLYDANTMQELDAFAVPEARDPRFAGGFGDLSIHETANDPVTNLAYLAYYSAGFRVMSFGDRQLTEVGRFIDTRGNNFWGVDVMTDTQGGRLILASDRDYGLYVLRYTGPGAVRAPAAAAPPAPAPAAPVVRPFVRPSSFFAFGGTSRLTVRNRRVSMTIRVPGAGRTTAQLRARIGRRTITIARATRTATRAGSLRLTFRLSQLNDRRLRNTLRSRRSRRTSGVARVSFTRTGGVQRTRDRSLSIARR